MVSIVFGLLGTALGPAAEKIASWHTVSRIEVGIVIFSAFLSFVAGGWAAGKICGARRSEPAILHGAISWLVATPVMIAMLAAGASVTFGGWYGGLLTSPIGAVAAPSSPDVIRNTAAAALTALLLGLIGSAIGGWLASGEPMSIMHHRTRDTALPLRKESA